MTLYEILRIIIAFISTIFTIWATFIAWKSYKNKRKEPPATDNK